MAPVGCDLPRVRVGQEVPAGDVLVVQLGDRSAADRREVQLDEVVVLAALPSSGTQRTWSANPSPFESNEYTTCWLHARSATVGAPALRAVAADRLALRLPPQGPPGR